MTKRDYFDIDQTWIINNLDTLAHNYLRRLFEIPASGTLSIVMLTNSQFGLNIMDISTKFKQCQVVMRQCLKNSCNHDINNLVQVSSDKSKQYDTFNSTESVIKSIRNDITNKIKENLTTQGLVIRYVWDSILANTKAAWMSVQKSLPKNIYNFTIRYLNNTLPNMSNMFMWGHSGNKACQLCHHNQTLGHVVAGCKSSLDQGRYTWRHDSVLSYIANTLSRFCKNVYADIPSFASPCIVTGNNERPDIVVVQQKVVTIIELTIGFETNMEGNSKRKRDKYKTLKSNLLPKYDDVRYVNVSMGACGFIEKDSRNFFDLLRSIRVPENEILFLTKRITNICIRSSYYIFCLRNKEWTSPELLSF